MPDDKTPDDWPNAVARESERQSGATLKAIGKRLRAECAKIVEEPLPDKNVSLTDRVATAQRSEPRQKLSRAPIGPKG